MRLRRIPRARNAYGRFGDGGGDSGESKMLFEGGRHGAFPGVLFFGVGVQVVEVGMSFSTGRGNLTDSRAPPLALATVLLIPLFVT